MPVQQPKATPTFVSGKSNQVLACTDVQMVATRFVNAEGEEALAICLVWGQDAEDGKPGVYVLANQEDMKRQIKMPQTYIKKGVREWLASRQAPTSDEVPDTLGDFDLPDVDRPKKGRARVEIGDLETK